MDLCQLDWTSDHDKKQPHASFPSEEHTFKSYKMSEIHSVGPFILGKSLGSGSTGMKRINFILFIVWLVLHICCLCVLTFKTKEYSSSLFLSFIP